MAVRERIAFLSVRRLLGAAATLALGMAVVGVALGERLPFVDGVARAAIASATGPFVANDGEGQAVFVGADGMVPGGSPRSGEVTVANSGDGAGVFTLRARDLVDAPVVPGLSSVLHLEVRDVTPGSPVRVVYAGTALGLAAAPVSLGSFAPGESHRYRFEVAYPDGPAVVDNAAAARAHDHHLRVGCGRHRHRPHRPPRRSVDPTGAGHRAVDITTTADHACPGGHRAARDPARRPHRAARRSQHHEGHRALPVGLPRHDRGDDQDRRSRQGAARQARRIQLSAVGSGRSPCACRHQPVA